MSESLNDQMTSAIAGMCERLTPATRLSTADVVNHLWPHDPAVRAAAFSLLTRPPVALEPYWTRGAEMKGKFGKKRPYLWHAPQPVCPCCNGTGRQAVVAPDPVNLAWRGKLYDSAEALAAAKAAADWDVEV